MFPVYIKEPNTEPPETDVYYIVARNGVFFKKKNGWIDATVPVKQIAVLEEQAISAKILLPNLSSVVMAKTIKFFKAVFKKYQSEAAVLLHYNKEKGYEISIPEQKVTSAHAEYNPMERLEEYNCIGTIHSHGRMSAFHSETDTHDEAQHDGVHITIGDMDYKDCFSMDGEIVVNGARFGLDGNWIEGLKKVERKIPNQYYFFQQEKKYYAIDCFSLNGWVMPEEWMTKVKHDVNVIKYVYPSSLNQDFYTDYLEALVQKRQSKIKRTSEVNVEIGKNIQVKEVNSGN